MRITPLEIRRKTFEKKIRGFDKDEVNAFLGSLSQEWERLLNENKELRVKQEYADLEVKKLREIIQRSPMALQVKARKLKTYSDKQQAEFRKCLHKREAAKDF